MPEVQGTTQIKLVPLRAAAERLGISHWTLRVWIRKKVVRCYVRNTRVFISESDIDRLIAESMQTTKKEAINA
jgi:predicted site-specific integrase-resolvase